MSRPEREFDCDVLIAGAGPVGMTLALALQQAGVDFRIVERAEGFSGESKAITLQPRTLEQLHLLGAAQRLVDAGLPSGVMHMHDGRRRMTTLRYDRLPTPFPYYLHLHQGETERLLADLLAERGVSIERGQELTGFRIGAADEGASVEGVEVDLDDGRGAPRRLRCRYLVGCDGGRSRVRAQLGVEFSGERHGDHWIMADARIEGFDLAPDERHGFMLETYPFVILPMREGYFRIIAARPADSDRLGQDPDLAEFEAIAKGLGFGHWRLHSPLWLTHYRPSQFIASRFRRGPVFLAGDAAHVNTPIAAQGLNTGVMDAANLAWKLSWVLRHGGADRLLDSYHDERHPAVLKMFHANNRLTRMVFGRHRLLRKLARRQLRLLQLARLNLRNTSGSAQLAVAYRDSPVTVAEPGAGMLARLRARLGGAPGIGDRAPCPPLAAPPPGAGTLYDLLDPVLHTLLVFDGADGAQDPWASQVNRTHAGWLQVLRFRPGDSAIIKDALPDPGGAIAAAFGLVAGGAALLRPDAYIAARLELGDNQALRHYLDLLGGVGQAEATANRERSDLPGVRWHPPSAVRS